MACPAPARRFDDLVPAAACSASGARLLRPDTAISGNRKCSVELDQAAQAHRIAAVFEQRPFGGAADNHRPRRTSAPRGYDTKQFAIYERNRGYAQHAGFGGKRFDRRRWFEAAHLMAIL